MRFDDPGAAQELLRRELSRSEYNQQSPIDRLWDWFTSFWARVTGEAAQADHLSALAVIVVVLAAAAVLLLAVTRLGRDRRGSPRSEEGVLDTGSLTADDLRRRAETAAEEGRPEAAVADAVRALARRTVQRGLLDDSPGRTTHEVLALVAQRFPDHQAALEAVADEFDAVVYGSRPASTEDVRDALLLDEQVRRSRPVAAQAAGVPTRLEVPR